MFSLFYFFPLGLVLQAVAIVHFIRRRPDGWWLLIIIFGGGLGATVYLLVEALPDLRESGGTRFFARRSRIGELRAEIELNPSAGNYEELGDLYLQDGKYSAARECFSHSISARTDSPDPFYRRALASLGLGDYPAALPDLERVVAKDPGYDFHRAAGLLAHTYAQTGQPDKADTWFTRATQASTLSETEYYHAHFLASQGRAQEARACAERLLARRRTMPAFQRRRDRPWFRRASSLLSSLPRNS